MSDLPEPKPKRGLLHRLIAGLIVLAILWVTRGYWGEQGIAVLILAALLAGIMAEYAAAKIMKIIERNKDPKE